MDFETNIADNEISFLFDSKAYRKETLYGAALVFSNECYVYVQSLEKRALKVTLKGKKRLGEEDLKSLAGEFHNEMLAQSLRWMVARHNRKTREAIELQALYAAQVPRRVSRKNGKLQEAKK